MTTGHHLFCRIGILVGRRTAAKPAIGIEPNGVTEFAAEQVVNWFAQRLALDIPQRNINPADRGGGQTACAQIGVTAIHGMPERLNVGRVSAD